MIFNFNNLYNFIQYFTFKSSFFLVKKLVMNLGLMKDSVFPQAVRANVNRFNDLIFLVARGMDSALPSGPSGAGDGGFGRRPGRFADDRHGGSSSTASGAVAIDQSRLPTCPRTLPSLEIYRLMLLKLMFVLLCKCVIFLPLRF